MEQTPRFGSDLQDAAEKSLLNFLGLTEDY